MKKVFLITIDTEGDNLWNVSDIHQDITTENAKYLFRFQELCEKYGFIVRYPKGKEAKTKHDFCPWHLRYVGGVHAAIMDEKDMCLEEYIDFLKGFSFDKSFSYAYNGVNYEIYTSPAKNSAEPARVPVSGTYTVSGDNIGTFIITTVKN